MVLGLFERKKITKAKRKKIFFVARQSSKTVGEEGFLGGRSFETRLFASKTRKGARRQAITDLRKEGESPNDFDISIIKVEAESQSKAIEKEADKGVTFG